MEAIQIFARTYRVRARRDECGELIVRGKHGHVFDHGDGRQFGIALLDNPPTQPTKARTLVCQRRKALACGFVPHQIGDCEVVMLFDPENADHARLALKLVGVRRRRRLSEGHKQRLFAASRATRYGARPTVLGGKLATGARDAALVVVSVGLRYSDAKLRR